MRNTQVQTVLTHRINSQLPVITLRGQRLYGARPPCCGQSTERYRIGGHANVSSDYKKTEPSTIQKNIHSHHHHVIDILNKFREQYVPPALLIMSQTRLPSTVTVFCQVLTRLPVFRECHRQNTCASSNPLRISPPKVRHFECSTLLFQHSYFLANKITEIG